MPTCTSIIDQHRLDIDHVTERRGRPYTLVCTKNRASLKRRLAEYAKDVAAMRTLLRSAPAGEQSAACTPGLARLARGGGSVGVKLPNRTVPAATALELAARSARTRKQHDTRTTRLDNRVRSGDRLRSAPTTP